MADVDHEQEWRDARKKYYASYVPRWIPIDDSFDLFGHTLLFKEADGSFKSRKLVDDGSDKPSHYWSF